VTHLLYAQVNTFPYSESFEDPFTNGNKVYFLPNWWGNYVGLDTMGQYTGYVHTGAHALFMVPEGEELTTIAQVELDLTDKNNNVAEFWVATRKNGSSEDLKHVKLSVAFSYDGGATFPFVTRLGSHRGFPNENTSYEKFMIAMPPVVDNQSDVTLRFVGKSGGGPHLPAKLLLDDVSVYQSDVDSFPPYIVGSELAIQYADAITIPFSEPLQADSALLVDHYNFTWPVEEDGTPIIGEGPLPEVSDILLSDDGYTITLALNPALSIGETYALEMYNITDLNGNAVDTLSIDEIVFNIPEPGSLVFSEVLFADPSAAFPMDKLQYIEIYNPTTRTIPIGGLRIKGAISSHNFPNVKLKPGEYFVTTRNAEAYFETFGKTAHQWMGSWIEYSAEEGEELEPQSLYIQTTDRHGASLIDSIGFDFNDANWMALNQLGRSIELCNKFSDNLDVNNWSVAESEPYSYNYNGYEYIIYATPAAGCSDGVTPVVDLGEDGNYCGISSLALDATNEDAIYLWSTGDESPTITITESGTYSVVVVNGKGAAYDTISVAFVPDISADIIAEPSICADDEMVFESVANGAVSWDWDFGDGATSSIETPVHTYTLAGNHTAFLTVTNEFGCTASATAEVEVFGVEAEVAWPALVCENTSVDFAASGVSIESWNWTFGDGNESKDQNPSYTFVQEGSYEVSLTIINDRGCSKTFTESLQVVNTNFSWTIPEEPACTFTDLFFEVEGIQGGDYHWQFGDGLTSNLESATHSFTSSGVYDISLTVTTAEGCSTTLEETLAVGICVGTENNDFTEQVSIYPNPANDFIALSTGKPLEGTLLLKIYNLKGVLMKAEQWSNQFGQPYILDVSQWSEGVYFITLQTGSQYVSKKMIVTR